MYFYRCLYTWIVPHRPESTLQYYLLEPGVLVGSKETVALTLSFRLLSEQCVFQRSTVYERWMLAQFSGTLCINFCIKLRSLTDRL